jgi:hypothetical protein
VGARYNVDASGGMVLRKALPRFTVGIQLFEGDILLSFNCAFALAEFAIEQLFSNTFLR